MSLSSGDTLRARYPVAADGGRSAVRRALGIDMTGETVDPNPTLVTEVRVTGLDRDNRHIFPPRDGTDLASDFRPRAALADRFHSGRVFLAGDAAHVHSPAGGQGLNTSVQGACDLGWKLGAVLTDGAPAELLDSYEEERRTIAAQMLDLSTGVHRGEVRRGGATRQRGLGYRESPLTSEARERLPRARRGPGTAHPTARSTAYGSSTPSGAALDTARAGHRSARGRHGAGGTGGAGRCAPCVRHGTVPRTAGRLSRMAGNTPDGLDGYLGRLLRAR